MEFDEMQISDLKKIAPNLSTAQEGGYDFILIEGLALPEGCKPSVVDALLCPAPKNGYESRLFFSEKIEGIPPNRNWNEVIRVLDKNWQAISWRVLPGLSLKDMLLVHLRALRND